MSASNPPKNDDNAGPTRASATSASAAGTERQPRPTDIKLHQKSRVLELHFDDGYTCNLTCEYLRINSPSAEVQGHGPGQEVLQLNKEDVGISNLMPAGNYAIKIHFDDGHDTGIFTWGYLYALGTRYEENWKNYLDRLAAAGHTRKDTVARD